MRVDLTRRGDYAIRAMLDLARHDHSGRRSVREIAATMDIPVRFLPQVMGDLVRAGLVEAQAGRTGGYRLRRPAIAISVLDVVEAIEGESRIRTCVLRGGPCGLDGSCDVHAVFAAAQDGLNAPLASTSLAELAGRDERR